MATRDFLPRSFLDLPADGDDDAIIGRGPNITMRDRAALLAERRLEQAVGERQPNQPDDVAQVETLVRATGDLGFRPEHPPTGLFSAPLRDAIRGFQRRSGLTQDGVVNPDGETFQALTSALDREEAETVADVEDPGGETQLALRCRQIAVKLANGAVNLQNHEQNVDQERQRLEDAVDRLRNAEVSNDQIAAEIALGVASIGASLASGNFLAAIAQAIALADEYRDSRAELGEAAWELDRAARQLEVVVTGRDEKRDELAGLEAERDRLGCSSITL